MSYLKEMADLERRYDGRIPEVELRRLEQKWFPDDPQPEEEQDDG